MSAKAYIRLLLFAAVLFTPVAVQSQQVIQITTSSPLPDGFVGQQYSTEIQVAGSISAPTSWSIVAGDLPPGLDLNPSFDIAFVAGTPTQPGVFNFTIRFTSGSMMQSAQKAFQLTIFGPLQITTSSPLPQGVAGVNYSTQIKAAGGFPPYQWSVIAGSLPPGIMLNSQTGFLTGSTVAGDYSFLIGVMDTHETLQEKNFTVRFVEPPVITTRSPLPPATTGTPYNFQFMATGGTPPYMWSRQSPLFSLPAGMTISPDGLLSGTPTVSGTFRLPIKVTDSEGAQDAGNFDLTIVGGLQITTGSPLPGGNVGKSYMITFMAAGGNPPYAWSVVSGALPAGLTLNPQTGLLQGTPSAGGPHTFTVRVRDAQEKTDERQFTLMIAEGSRPKITTAPPVPNGIVGQRYTFAFAASGGTPPYRWEIGTGALPPGLDLNPLTGEVSGTPSAATNVEFTLTVTDTQPDADAKVFRLISEVDPGLPPSPAFEPGRLLEGFPRQPRRAVRHIRVLNRGGGTLRYNVSAETDSAGNWIAVSPSRVDASSEAPGVVTVSILPPTAGMGGCGPNGCTLRGAVVFQPLSGGAPERVPVIAAVSPRDNLLNVTPRGLTFTGAAGGPNLPGQAVRVQNLGTGNVNWEAVVANDPGDNNWLLVDPRSGTAGPDSSDAFAVQVDTAGRAPGVYYGTVEVRSPSDPGGTKLVTVIANILPAGSNVNPYVEPRGLIFTAAAGNQPPPTQPVFVYNPTPNPLAFDALLVANLDGSTAVRSFPGLNVRAGERLQLDVQSVFSPSLAPGVYRGFMKLTFAAGFRATVDLTLIITPGSAGVRALPMVSQGACTATKLVPELTSFSGGYPANAAWPAYLRVRVMDDCMNPLTQGTVTARFGNGNPADLALGSASSDGTWLGTLTFPAATATVSNSVTIDAAGAGAPALTGSVTRAFEVGGLVDSPPVLVSEGIVNGASYVAHPLSPGSIFAVFGTGLSNHIFNAALPFGGGEQAPSLPIPTTLGGTRLFFAGSGFAPILFSLDLQANAITPFALTSRVNESVDVRAQRGGTLSMPVPVFISDAQPAMFTQNGTGSGSASIVHLDGSLVNAAHPAVAGEVILIFLTGLGAVNPPIQDGHPSCEPDGVCLSDGSNLVIRSTAGQVSMTIGGVAIPQGNIAFAGLAPGFAGLYQMNVIMPAGLPSGDQPLKLTLGSQTSPDGVTIRIQ